MRFDTVFLLEATMSYEREELEAQIYSIFRPEAPQSRETVESCQPLVLLRAIFFSMVSRSTKGLSPFTIGGIGVRAYFPRVTVP